MGRYASCMTPGRSAASTRNGRPLVAGVLLPVGLLAALTVAVVAMLAIGAGRHAAVKELDARAATVKKAWELSGRPSTKPELALRGRRLNASLSVVPGARPAPAATSGDVRRYAFPTRARRTLRVAL